MHRDIVVIKSGPHELKFNCNSRKLKYINFNQFLVYFNKAIELELASLARKRHLQSDNFIRSFKKMSKRIRLRKLS